MKNTDFLITIRLPQETMREAICLAKVARQLNQAQWLVDWSPKTNKVLPQNPHILPWGCYSIIRKI
jgi:hypothetical protein